MRPWRAGGPLEPPGEGLGLLHVPTLGDVLHLARGALHHQEPSIRGPLHVGGRAQVPGEGPHVNPPRPAADLDLLHFLASTLLPRGWPLI